MFNLSVLNFHANIPFRHVLKRCKHKKIHWATKEKKNFPIDKALQHFDDFYKTIFRLRWPSVRLALLSPRKYVALVNNFGNIDSTMTQLECQGAVDIRKLFDIEKENLKDLKDNSLMKDARKRSTLDRILKNRSYNKEMEEVGHVYQNNTNSQQTVSNVSENITPATPLAVSLSMAEIDSARVIDPDNAIDSSALFEFVPATRIKGLDDYVPESQHYKYYKVDLDFPIDIEIQENLSIPENLRIYSFPRGDVSDFPAPRRGSLDVLNYYLLDGASILPILALGINQGDYVLDMCAAPGGKSLAAIQTLYPKVVVSNDSSISRSNRMTRMFKDYLPITGEFNNQLLFKTVDGSKIDDAELYDKILVDVPCTNDRLSLFENDNNIFSNHRIKERLKIPETQANLLSNALKIVRKGGTVVYSTCSLSPIQNDGVVAMALRKSWEDTKREFAVMDMRSAFRCTSKFFQYGNGIGLKYGQLVIPFLPCNFGPLYFSKIVRKK